MQIYTTRTVTHKPRISLSFRTGFTVLELLVTVAIITVLLALIRNRTPEPVDLARWATFLVFGVGRGGLVCGRPLVGVHPGGTCGVIRGVPLSMRAGPTMPNPSRPQARGGAR